MFFGSQYLVAVGGWRSSDVSAKSDIEHDMFIRSPLPAPELFEVK